MGTRRLPNMPSTSRWSTAPSVLDQHREPAPTAREQRAADFVTPFPGRNRPASRFDTPRAAPAHLSPEQARAQPAQQYTAQAPPDVYARVQIAATPAASVDLIKNKGGEQERAEFKAQIDAKAASARRDFNTRLSGIQAVSTQGIGHPNTDRGHESGTRDKLASLKARFDSALK